MKCSMFHVKHLDHSLGLTPASVIRAISSVGVAVSPRQAELLISHAELVVEVNARINLTRLTEPEDVLWLHIVDSLAFLPMLAPLSGRVVDIGSGAGYPGVPLAILGSTVTLCESVKKKALFLEDVVSELALSASVKPLRAEELADQEPAAADFVVARAVSATASLVELAAPLLRIGGRLIALKGVPTADELGAGAAAADSCGMVPLKHSEYALPGGEQRTVLVYEKVKSPSVHLPRRPGAAQRQPLG